MGNGQGLADYFIFYNNERPHQSLGQKTPEIVYRSAIGGGAVIVEKFSRAVEETPVPLSSTEVSSTAEATTLKTKARTTKGQCDKAANQVKRAA
jgi:putative transposase